VTSLLVWWQLRSVSPQQDDGWLSWDYEDERPYRFNSEDEAFAALETFKRENGTWRLAEGWSGRVVMVVQEQSYFDVEYSDRYDASK